jgi:hypothetical protein
MTMSSLIITRMAPQLPPKDKNNPNYKDRTLLETYKKNALTLTFRDMRTAPASRVEWEEYYLHLVSLVIEDPKILLSESKNLMHHLALYSVLL